MNEEKEKIKKEVDKTLASLDEIGRVEANPFLFTRVMQGMQKEEKRSFLSFQVITPVAMVVLLLVINIVTVFKVADNINKQNRAAYIDELAKEYALNFNDQQSSFYYLEE